MSADDSLLFASKPFTFIVQGKPFYVHAGLISDASKPLDRMINGDLSEAKQGFALLGDVDEATFVRFIRWTYNKEYPTAEHTEVDESGQPRQKDWESWTAAGAPSPSAAAVGQARWQHYPDADWNDGWNEPSWHSSPVKNKKRRERSGPVTNWIKETFIINPESDWLSKDPLTPPIRSNRGPLEDYTEVFLCHARLYVFSEKYDIQPLKDLALHKLHHTLSLFTLYPSRVGDIITLINYIYANTVATKDGVEDIRTMVMHYVTTELQTLVADGEIKDVFVDNPDMLADFMKMLALQVS